MSEAHGSMLSAALILLWAGLLVARRLGQPGVSTEAAGDRVVKVGSLQPGSIKILIVDDDATCRVLMIERLRKRGYQTCAGWDGVSAIDAARKANPTLMIVDLSMPNGDGFAVMRRLRELDTTKNLPVIVFTASNLEECRKRALEFGAVNFLQKDVDDDVLERTIRDLSIPIPSRTGPRARTAAMGAAPPEGL